MKVVAPIFGSLIYSVLISLFALFQPVFEPNPLFVGLVIGSLFGLLARLALDVSRNGKQKLASVAFECGGTFFLVIGCGMMVIELAMDYFNIPEQIAAGQMSKDLPQFLAIGGSCLTTYWGLDGIKFAFGIIKVIIQHLAGVKADELSIKPPPDDIDKEK
jgi:hypothetical protein